MGRKSRPHVAVIGAGAFGGWTALSLLRTGARVTLVDAWGAGNSRSSSGDETRVIRTMYNGDPLYTDMVSRAFVLWREAEARWGRTVYRKTGAIYFFEGDDAFARRSLPLMRERGIPVETLTPAEGAKRFPQIGFDGVRISYVEPEAGYLLARESCELVRESVAREGGTYRQARVRPGRIASGRLAGVLLDGGDAIGADVFVFACGPWLGRVFPDAVAADGIVATRQDVLYIGPPAGDTRFDAASCPIWVNFGARCLYGIPGNERRGFKVADDTAGPPINPDSLDRVVSSQVIRRARAFLARRFPVLASQPIVETRVCQYEYSPDGDFLLDRHPGAGNVWLVGGGSGHGFKMGPALGEYVARLVLDRASPDPKFSYAHFHEGRARVRRTRQRKVHS
jgi:glycine/D-amino acid oxidase-like deaminating enzyme